MAIYLITSLAFSAIGQAINIVTEDKKTGLVWNAAGFVFKKSIGLGGGIADLAISFVAGYAVKAAVRKLYAV